MFDCRVISEEEFKLEAAVGAQIRDGVSVSLTRKEFEQLAGIAANANFEGVVMQFFVCFWGLCCRGAC